MTLGSRPHNHTPFLNEALCPLHKSLGPELLKLYLKQRFSALPTLITSGDWDTAFSVSGFRVLGWTPALRAPMCSNRALEQGPVCTEPSLTRRVEENPAPGCSWTLGQPLGRARH